MDSFYSAHAIAGLVAFCGPGGLPRPFGVAGTLCLTALVGGFAHCAPMCGPFVLMQVSEGGGLAIRKLVADALPSYQLGRLTTYVVLGGIVGGLGGSVLALGSFRAFAAILLGLAASSFLLQALKLAFPRLLGPIFPRWGAWLARPLGWLLHPGRRTAFGGYPLGLVLGLLPCGFLYAALFAAAATGSAVAGVFAMAAFALGTMPALMIVGLFGAGVAQRWRRIATRLAAPVFLFNALILISLAAHSLAAPA